MIQSHYPSAEQLMKEQRARSAFLMGLLVLTILLVFGLMGGLLFFFPTLPGPVIWLIGVVLFLFLAVPVIVWNNPRIGFYILLVGVMLFETNPGEAAYRNVRVPTMLVPFFWNISTIGRSYGTTVLEPLVFSIAEALMVLTFLTWIIRSIVKRDFRFERGAFFVGFAAYMGMVVFGYVHGVTSGGNPKIALWEVRAQFYFFMAYLLAANLITERKHVYPVLWIVALCIGLKSLFGTYNFFSRGGAVGYQGVMSHEEALFFNVLFMLTFVSWLSNADRRIKIAALLFTPTAAIALMAGQRRAGIASFIIGFIPLLPLLWCILEQRRKQVLTFAGAFAFATMVYLPMAWNATGAWALPARAIRSNSDPNQRDAGSNAYRMAEDANLRRTRDTQPWIGIGYGKPFATFFAMPDIKYQFRQIMPHNSLLWVWMRLGHIGYFCFWLMVALVLIKGVHILKETQDTLLQTMGVLAIITLLMLITFGKYDLQLVNYRSVIMTGAFIGVLSVLRKLAVAPSEKMVVETLPPAEGATAHAAGGSPRR